jgi:hypothetical protein
VCICVCVFLCVVSGVNVSECICNCLFVSMSVAIAVVTSFGGSGNYSFANGVGTQASFASPRGVAVDVSGTVFVVDSGNNRIRAISPTGGTSGAYDCSSTCSAVVLRWTRALSCSSCHNCCQGRVCLRSSVFE